MSMIIKEKNLFSNYLESSPRFTNVNEKGRQEEDMCEYMCECVCAGLCIHTCLCSCTCVCL